MKKTKTIEVSTSKLDFDRSNPRLVVVDDLKTASDQQIMCALAEHATMSELVDSIVANNYLDIEPLIVTKKGVLTEGNYRVLEGNRRLCAIRFIKSPESARHCKVSVPSNISEDVFLSIENVTVYIVEDEEEARSFIGFKHINGAHRWESYAKARFLYDWYIRDYDNGVTIEDIAQKMGDSNHNTRSMVSGMLVLNQAESMEIFHINDRTKPGKFGFSHLYTALARIEYRNFLGLDKNWSQRPKPNPIDSKFTHNLELILRYIYGSKKDGIESVVKSQNPDIKDLGSVIQNPLALNVLQVTNNLAEAYEEVRPSEDVFRDVLIIAHKKVQDVLKKVGKFSPKESDSLMQIAEEMSDNAESALLIMNNKLAKNNKLDKG